MADVGNSFAIANLLPIAHANVDIKAEQKAEVVLSAVQPKTPQLSSTEPIKLHTRPLLRCYRAHPRRGRTRLTCTTVASPEPEADSCLTIQSIRVWNIRAAATRGKHQLSQLPSRLVRESGMSAIAQKIQLD